MGRVYYDVMIVGYLSPFVVVWLLIFVFMEWRLYFGQKYRRQFTWVTGDQIERYVHAAK